MGEKQQDSLKEYLQFDPNHPDETLGMLLDACGHYFAHRIGCSRRGRGNVIALLAQRPGITQKELAQLLGVQPASVSELLRKLERKGLVRREKDAQDRRSVRVTLTEAGHQHQARMDQRQPAPFSALTAEEQASLASLLQKLLLDWQQRFPVERGGNRERPADSRQAYDESIKRMEEANEQEKE